jgi:hypothetical protein
VRVCGRPAIVYHDLFETLQHTTCAAAYCPLVTLPPTFIQRLLCRRLVIPDSDMDCHNELYWLVDGRTCCFCNTLASHSIKDLLVVTFMIEAVLCVNSNP